MNKCRYLIAVMIFLLTCSMACTQANTSLIPISSTQTTLTTSAYNSTLPPGLDLEFQSITIGNDISNKDTSTRMDILGTYESSLSVNGVDSQDIQKIKEIDFNQYYVIIAFLGWRAYWNNSINIIKVRQNGTDILVIADIKEAGQNETVAPAYSSRYHIIKLLKSETFLASQFKLIDSRTLEVLASGLY